MIFSTTCFDVYRLSSGLFYRVKSILVLVYRTYMIAVADVGACCLFGECFSRAVFCC